MPRFDAELATYRLVLHPDRRRLAWDQAEHCCDVSGVALPQPESAIVLDPGGVVSLAVAWLWGLPEIASIWRQERKNNSRIPGIWTEGSSLGGVYRPYNLLSPERAVCPPEGMFGPAMPTVIALRILTLWVVWKLSRTASQHEAMSIEKGLVWGIARHVLCPSRRKTWHALGQRDMPPSSIDHYPLPPDPDCRNWLSVAESTNVGPGLWIPRLVGADGQHIWFKKSPDTLIKIPPENVYEDFARHPHFPDWILPLIQEALKWFDEEDRTEFLLFGGRVTWSMDEATRAS